VELERAEPEMPPPTLLKRIERLKEEKKVQQVVWIRASAMAKILELAAGLGKAPNIVVAELAEAAVEAMERGEWRPIAAHGREKEEQKVKVTICPTCFREFHSVAELADHLSSNASCIDFIVQRAELQKKLKESKVVKR